MGGKLVSAAFWTRRAGRPVTPEDARAITENLCGFVSLLGEWAEKEATSTTGTADEAGGDE